MEKTLTLILHLEEYTTAVSSATYFFIMADILSDLNDSQRAAVEYCYSPELVIAGAGSGKTRVLTYKIAYLLKKGMKPWNILALTFTNKAAREMKSRIGVLVGDAVAQRLYMGTFHSVFSRILHVEAETIGYKSNFTIYDEQDARSLVSAIIKDMGLDDKVYKPATVLGRISMAKNSLLTPWRYLDDSYCMERDIRTKMSSVHKIYSEYWKRCRTAGAMDFDDLLLMTYILFKEHKDILAKYASRFEYILVDEYQDTNFAQQSILGLLTKSNRHVCVVGDDAQSIYAFRGANVDNMLNFQKIYPDARLFKLEQNYRSTQTIVAAANSLIKHNDRQIPKDVFSENEKGDKIVVKSTYSDKEEASVLCNEIKRIRRKDKCSYKDFCILYRTNAQSRCIESELRMRSIPYRIFGGLSFYQRKEIKDIVAYFRLVSNPDDEEAFKRIVNCPARGIGATTVLKLSDAAHRAGVSLWAVLSSPVSYGLNINAGTRAKLLKFHNLIQSFIDRLRSDDAFDLGRDIIDRSGITADIYADKSPENMSRQENVGEFVSAMREFVDQKREEGDETGVYLPYFLQDVALLTDSDTKESTSDMDSVSLMTIHSSKGLEFPTVFIAGLEDGLFPGQSSVQSVRALEEERRLLYVAITRAEKHCLITWAKSRYMYGKMSFCQPSRFLKEIDPTLISGNLKQDSNSFIDESGPDMSFSSLNKADLRNGTDSTRNVETSHYKRTIIPGNASASRVQNSGFISVNKTNMSDASTYAPSSSQKGKDGVAGRLKVGDTIEHQRFGIGKIVHIEGVSENAKATVLFENVGTKQLLLKFARFKILN